MASIVVQLGVFGYYYGSMIRTVYYRDYDRLNFDEWMNELNLILFLIRSMFG